MGDQTPPRWAAPATLTLCLVGVAAAGYLTYDHFTGHLPLSCPENSVINCAKVTTSPESKVFGVPVALLGLLYYLVLTPLMTPLAWRRPRFHRVRLAALTSGLLFVGYLLFVELFRLHAICLWCTGVHVITLAVFITTLFANALAEDPT